jgi:hypothetical protein
VHHKLAMGDARGRNETARSRLGRASRGRGSAKFEDGLDRSRRIQRQTPRGQRVLSSSGSKVVGRCGEVSQQLKVGDRPLRRTDPQDGRPRPPRPPGCYAHSVGNRPRRPSLRRLRRPPGDLGERRPARAGHRLNRRPRHARAQHPGNAGVARVEKSLHARMRSGAWQAGAFTGAPPAAAPMGKGPQPDSVSGKTARAASCLMIMTLARPRMASM